MRNKTKKQKPISNSVVISFRVDEDLLKNTDLKSEIQKLIFDKKTTHIHHKRAL